MLDLYDPAHLAIKKELALSGGEFKAFVYKNSLRFHILLREAPDTELTERLLREIKRRLSRQRRQNAL